MKFQNIVLLFLAVAMISWFGTPVFADSWNGVPHIADSEIIYEIWLTNPILQAGDIFELWRRAYQPGPDPLPVAEFFILDIYGCFFFYPGWSQSLDWETWIMEPDTEYVDLIMTFVWPPYIPPASGILIYGAIMDPDLTILYGMDMVELAWE